MLTLKQAINEIETKWELNDNTTIKDIEECYYLITGLHNLSTGKKLNYLYNYVIEAMIKDEAITDDVADRLYEIYVEGEDE